MKKILSILTLMVLVFTVLTNTALASNATQAYNMLKGLIKNK